MFNLSFTPNPAFLENFRRVHTTSVVQRLQAMANKTFSVRVLGREYTLRFEISDSGKVDIFDAGSPSSGSLTGANLQLNVGAFLLPEAIDLPQGVGLNPDARQTPFYEICEGSLAPAEVAAIMRKIEETGFLNIIYQKIVDR